MQTDLQPVVDDRISDPTPQAMPEADAMHVADHALPDVADATSSVPASGASSRPKSPVVHGSYEKAESDDDEVMVKTEFVWADGADLDVKLSGAWNGWMPVQMYHEGGMLY